MRSTFLLTLAAVAFAANAQTVQNIPNEEPLKIEGDYSVVTVATMPDDGSEPKARFKTDDEGIVQFDNMCNGDIAELKLNNTETTPFILHFQEGCKIDGTHINFSLINENGDTTWSDTYNPANNNKGWSVFANATIFIEDPIEAGLYTFRIEFLNDAGGTKSTANLREFVFEARESIVTYSLYTDIDPDEEAGRILASPNQDSYLEDTEITLTATANSGYKFLNWEVNGESYTENPYYFYITESTDVVAYFEKLKMDNDVPGWININTRAGLSKNGRVESKGKCTLDGETVNEDGNAEVLGNYRNGEQESFELNVTEDGSYQLNAAYASKNANGEEPKIIFAIYDKAAYDEDPSTAEPEWTDTLDCSDCENDWATFKTAKIDNVDLTKGSKILLLTFVEEKVNKYTANLLQLGFSLNGSFGSGVESIAAKPVVVRKAFNVLGVEVAPDAKGVVIFSDGKKVINK